MRFVLLLLVFVSVSGCSNRDEETVPFSPTDIAGLVRWGKADSLSLSSNDPVSSYTDQSGVGNHFVSTLTERPTFKTGVQNGLAAVQFDGSNDFLTCDGLAPTFSGTAKPFTFFWAGAHSALSVDQQCFFIAANITGTATPTHDLFYSGEGYIWWSDRRNDAATIQRAQGFECDTAWHTLIYSYDGSLHKIYVDGRLMMSAPAPGGAMTVNSFTYGSHRRSDGNVGFFNGYWGEDGIYNSALNSTQVGDLHTYLQGRWNTTATAPAYAPTDLGSTLVNWATPKTWRGLTNNAAATVWWNRSPRGTGSASWSVTGTYKTAVVNGKDALLMNGTSNIISDTGMAAVASGTSKAFTLFGVFKPTSFATDSHVFGFGGSTSTPVHRLMMTSGTPTYRLDRRNNANTLTTAIAGTPTTNVHWFIYSYDGSLATLVVDGVTVHSAVSLGSGAITLTTMQFGSFRSTEWMAGYFVEVGVCDTATSGSRLTDLGAYLAGVAGNATNRRRRLLIGASQ